MLVRSDKLPLKECQKPQSSPFYANLANWTHTACIRKWAFCVPDSPFLPSIHVALSATESILWCLPKN